MLFVLETGVVILSRAGVANVVACRHRAFRVARAGSSSAPLSARVMARDFVGLRSTAIFPRRLTARGCALTRSSVNLAGHGGFNHAFRFSRIVDINKKHTIFVCFLFWEPASSYSPGPCPAKYHLR